MSGPSTWKCLVCGFEANGTEPPATCPVCGVGPDLFEQRGPAAPLPAAPTPLPRPEPTSGATWRCLVCGYLHSGDTPPSTCPICGVGPDLFSAAALSGNAAASTRDQAATPVVEDGPRLVILGGGIAGVAAAEAARQAAPNASITLISREPGLPCYRLNLTPYLAGLVPIRSLEVHPRDWYAERRIRLVAGEVVEIDLQASRVALLDGTTHPFDRLVLATGSHPFVPPVPGMHRERVHALRSLADAEALLAAVKPGRPAAVLGGGLLGLEAAAAMARRGARVTVLEGAPHLLPRQLSSAGARHLQASLASLGIQVHCGVQASAITGDEAVRGVRLATGDEIGTDLLVVAVGVRPNVHLPAAAGLRTDRGVLVDDRMVTSDPRVLAAGDLAEHATGLYGLWTAAQIQGRIAGINAVGGSEVFQGLPAATTLKVVGTDVFSTGAWEGRGADDRVWERDLPNRYARVVARDGRVVGANLLGDLSEVTQVREAVEQVLPVETLLPAMDGLLPAK